LSRCLDLRQVEEKNKEAVPPPHKNVPSNISRLIDFIPKTTCSRTKKKREKGTKATPENEETARRRTNQGKTQKPFF